MWSNDMDNGGKQRTAPGQMTLAPLRSQMLSLTLSLCLSVSPRSPILRAELSTLGSKPHGGKAGKCIEHLHLHKQCLGSSAANASGKPKGSRLFQEQWGEKVDAGWFRKAKLTPMQTYFLQGRWTVPRNSYKLLHVGRSHTKIQPARFEECPRLIRLSDSKKAEGELKFSWSLKLWRIRVKPESTPIDYSGKHCQLSLERGCIPSLPYNWIWKSNEIWFDQRKSLHIMAL